MPRVAGLPPRCWRDQAKRGRSRLVHRDTLFLSVALCSLLFGLGPGVPSAVAQESPSNAGAEAGNAADETEATEEEIPDSPTFLPSIEELRRPTAAEILQGKPTDWVIVELIRVLRVEPVEPRPNTLEAIEARISEFAKTKPVTSNQERLQKWREEFEKTADLEVVLVDDPFGRPYLLQKKHIDQMIHHETHALQLAARLRGEGDLATARELLEHVRRRDPNWPGLREERNALLFADAEALFARGESEQALSVFEQLLPRDPEYPQLELRMGQVTRAIARQAYADDDPRRARAFVARLRRSYPRHGFVAEIEKTRFDRARDLLASARAAESPAAASRFVVDAARYAPDLKGLKDAHTALYERYPILDVGVLSLASRPHDVVTRTTGGLRFENLAGGRLFAPYSVEGDYVRFRSQVVTGWTLEDLGRRAVVTLDADRSAFDGYRLAETLSSVTAAPEQFGDRWASMVAGVRPLGPDRVRIDLPRGPTRLDALLSRLPVRLEPLYRPADENATGGFRRDVVASTSFRAASSVAERPRGQFAEIVEHQYSDAEAFGRAIRRDEIALAVDVPPFLVARLKSESWFANEVILNKATVPTTHLLQFRPGSAFADSRGLRIALERATDRRSLLHEALLHTESGSPLGKEYARLTANIFPSFSYGNFAAAAVRPFDAEAAVPLALLARRQLGDRWTTFRMIAPDTPVIRDAAELVVDGWRKLGFPIELVPVADTNEAIETATWDIAYRVVAITEPSLGLWELLAAGSVPTLQAINYLEEPLRQRLIRLEETSDLPTASRLLAEAHKSILDQALLLPLWEVDRLSIRRRSIRGVPDDRLVSPYHRIDRWRVEPVFSLRAD